MPVLVVFSLAYILFLGRYVPGVFAFPGLSLETVLYRSYWSGDGMFGMVANISSTFVFMFILFGAFLLKSGAGDFIVSVAKSLAGRYQGGAGHVAVVGSGLMGSVSGSAVATTVSTGVLTIPMMTRSGFSPRFAAGVEAAASTGGQLMPPIMGAGAFVMSSYTQIPYLQIIAVSFLPAVLYFLTVAFFVRIEARRLGLATGDDEGQPSAWHALKGAGTSSSRLRSSSERSLPDTHLFARPRSRFSRSSSYRGFTDTPMNPRALRRGHTGCAAHHGAYRHPARRRRAGRERRHDDRAGQRLLRHDRRLAGGSLALTLLLVALASLILGMGLPVTASYIVLATLAAPALFDLISQQVLLDALGTGDLPSNIRAVVDLFGGDPLRALTEMPPEMRQLVRGELLDPALVTGMLLSAHLIIFWLSQDSNVTPPVCLVAFTAAAIAGTRPMRTGLTSWKIAKGLYLVPVLFAFTPLITGTWTERLTVFGFSCLGLYALAGLLQWHLEERLNALTALLLAASAVCLMWTPLGIAAHLAGAAMLIAIVVWQRRGVRR